MKRWQLLGSCGTTLGIVEAVTASGAVEAWRVSKDHIGSDFDDLYQIEEVIDAKILLADPRKIEWTPPKRGPGRPPGSKNKPKGGWHGGSYVDIETFGNRG